MKNIELLAPAGNFEALVAAVESGADAVYMGGNKFSARAYADNFDGDVLKRAVEYAHIRGVRVYVTVNTLINDMELQELVEYMGFLYSIDVDAIIIQDVALLEIVRYFYPDFEIHCSTQMSIHNSQGVTELADMGVKRVVLARELGISEVTAIANATDAELEVFVHGALCVCYSGQCLMSSMLGGRSGNRGRCAQPCRKKYTLFDIVRSKQLGEVKEAHLISTRDLCTYPRLDQLLAADIASLKIEGRMKKPEYVAIVVSNYRKAIDKLLAGNQVFEEKSAEYELLSAFNREFTEGYLFDKKNKDIVSIDRPDNRGVFLGKVINKSGSFVTIKVENGYLNDGDGIEFINKAGKSIGTIISGLTVKKSKVSKAKQGDHAEVFVRSEVSVGDYVNKTLDSELMLKSKHEYYFENKKRIPIACEVELRINKKPIIKLKDNDGNSVTYVGESIIEKALKVPTTRDKVSTQLQKTGEYPYTIDEISIYMDDDCNVAAKVINSLRREALELLNHKRSKLNRRVALGCKRSYSELLTTNVDDRDEATEIIAGVLDEASTMEAISAGADTIYILYNFGMTFDKVRAVVMLCNAQKKRCFLVLPTITKDSELRTLEEAFNKLREYEKPGVVVSNIGQLSFAHKHSRGSVRLNYTINVFNSIAAAFYSKSGIKSICLSPELNLNQIKGIHKNTGIRLEGIIYGHLPLMTTDYCPLSTLGQCSSCKSGYTGFGLKDERGKVFPIFKEGNCRTKILNSDVLYLIDELETIKSAGVKSLRADFLIESGATINKVISLAKKDFKDRSKTDIDTIEAIKSGGFTKGHYFRGVE